jgi:copper chaperone
MANVNLNVEGMSCGGCEKSIRNALLEHDGVAEVSASHESGIVAIEFDDAKIQQDQLKRAVEDAGFDVAA